MYLRTTCTRAFHWFLGTVGCLLGLVYRAGAQHFGGIAPDIKWQHAQMRDVEVVFPLGLQHHAARVAKIVQHLHDQNTGTVGERALPISIIVHNRTTESNGFVTLAPFRSEFFATPLQDVNILGSINWLDLLAIHEYRHVLQYSNARSGITNVAYFFLGELGWAAFANLAIPNWFWEGDAVLSETALTRQGRGRLPAFTNTYRSLLLTSPYAYNYMKARNGSLKHFVPNHYYLGFLLTAYGRERYGADFWKKVFRHGVRYGSIIYPFSFGIKKYSGDDKVTTRQYYEKVMAHYKATWQAGADTMTATEANQLTGNPGAWDFYSYDYPTFVNNTQLLVVKSSFKKIPYLTLLDTNGTEKPLTPLGYTPDNYFSHAQNTVVWAEWRFHPRWEMTNYTNIVTYDLKTGSKRQLTHLAKYVSPGLSSDAKRIAAVYNDPNLHAIIHILDAESGMVKQTISVPEWEYPAYPKFVENDRKVAFTLRNAKGEMALLTYDLAGNTYDTIIPYHENIIGQYHKAVRGWIYQSSYQGIDALFLWDESAKQPQLLVKRKVGVTQPAVNTAGDVLVFNEMDYQGHKLFALSLSDASATPTRLESLYDVPMHQYAFVAQELASIAQPIPNIPTSDTLLAFGPYNKRKNLINIHSWTPVLEMPNLGIELYSTDILQTLDANLGVVYNTNEQNGTVYGNIVYGQYYPYLGLGTRAIGTRNNYRDRGRIYNTLTEQRIDASVVIPLNFTAGIYTRQLSLGMAFRQHWAQYTTFDVFPNGIIERNSGNAAFPGAVFEVSYLQGRRKARQNIYTHLGQYVSYSAEAFSPDTKRYVDNVTPFFQHTLKSEFSLPGLFANHNLVFQAFALYRDVHSWYSPVNQGLFARNYVFADVVSVYENRSWSNFFTTLNANYHFPILYPDLGMANLIYFRRIRGNLFYDHGNVWSAQLNRDLTIGYNTATFQSYGIEGIFDLTLINLLDISVAVAYNELPQAKTLYPLEPQRAAQKLFFYIPVRFLF